MPMLTTLRIGLPVCPCPRPAADLVGKSRPSVEHGVDLRHDVLAIDQDRLALRGAQGHVQTARSSVTLIFSPRNIASMRPLRSDSSASCNKRSRVSSGDTVLGVIQEEPRGLGGEPLAARRIVREQLAKMHVAHF